MTIAFDIDDTLWKVRYRPRVQQVPDYDLIQVVRWFAANGDTVYFWSAGGVDYCQTVITRLGLDELGECISKGSIQPDVAFDDQAVELGRVNVRVNRCHSKGEHAQEV